MTEDDKYRNSRRMAYFCAISAILLCFCAIAFLGESASSVLTTTLPVLLGLPMAYGHTTNKNQQ